jgi:1,4-dihydroxy-2-naphthoyl-CoA synthase
MEKMPSWKIKEMIQKLLSEIEEEDIGISLLTTHYRDNAELAFFSEPDRGRVMEILHRLSEDSQRHKLLLGEVINCLTEKISRHP